MRLYSLPRPSGGPFPTGAVVGTLHTAAAAAADAGLLARARAGDTTALDPLIARHGSRVYRVALALTGSLERAEGVVQDVFVALLNRSPGRDGPDGLSRWLYRTTTRAALLRGGGSASRPPRRGPASVARSPDSLPETGWPWSSGTARGSPTPTWRPCSGSRWS